MKNAPGVLNIKKADYVPLPQSNKIETDLFIRIRLIHAAAAAANLLLLYDTQTNTQIQNMASNIQCH